MTEDGEGFGKAEGRVYDGGGVGLNACQSEMTLGSGEESGVRRGEGEKHHREHGEEDGEEAQEALQEL